MIDRKNFLRWILVHGIAFSCMTYYYIYSENPLRKYGVHIERFYDPTAATSSYPFLRVWCEYNGKRIDAPEELGGMPNPNLRFEDIDHDGILDIVFENVKLKGSGNYRQILAFKPPRGGRPPYFVIIEDNPL